MRLAVFIDSVHPILQERLEAMEYAWVLDEQTPALELAARYPSAEGIVARSRFRMDAAFIDSMPALKWIARSGSGLENIDVEYARSRGIEVFNSPEGNSDAVAEHAMAMLLGLLNHIPRTNQEVRSKLWRREANRGVEIKGKTVGVVGYGVMGSAFAKRLSSFGCRILAYDKYKQDFGNGAVEECDLATLQREADIVSLHVPLTQETWYMVEDSFLSAFHKNIWLMNTSRGPVVSIAALNRALRSGKVKGACLDVLEYEETSFEKLNLDQPDFEELISYDQVLLSPHVGGWTHESYVKLSSVLADKIEQWLNGQ